MRARLRSAAALAALQGLCFGVVMFALTIAGDHTSWQKALFEAAVATVLWVAIMWFAMRPQRAAVTAIVGTMTAEQQRDVLGAAKTGVPPADAALRPAAIELVHQRLAEYDRHRGLTLVGFAAFAVLSLLVAITDGLWWLAATAMFAWMLVWTLRYPGQLARRAASLEAIAPAPPTGTAEVH